MKTFSQIKTEQKEFCLDLYQKSLRLAQEYKNKMNISAILLTGSVARGDARKGPYGLFIDLLFILENCEINFKPVFGKDLEPDIPFFCGKVDGVGYQIQTINKEDFLQLPKPEDQSFAISESKSLMINDEKIELFIKEHFKTIKKPRKNIAMDSFHRFNYLTNSYRLEKWLYRRAFHQISENNHSALLCFTNFLYAINKSFIPRDDWKIYLLFELEITPDNLENIITALQTSVKTERDIEVVQVIIDSCNHWMQDQIHQLGW